MDAESKIEKLGLKLYIQLLLLEKDILKSIKIKFNEKIVNFLQIHYKHFYYSFTKYFVSVSKVINGYKIFMNNCNKNINPCSFNKKNKKYSISIEFKNNSNLMKYMNDLEKEVNINTKKIIESIKMKKIKNIKIPIQLFQFQCSEQNIKLLEQFVKKLKNILNKDNYLKKIIKNVEFIEN
jgi:hypothetical protein